MIKTLKAEEWDAGKLSGLRSIYDSDINFTLLALAAGVIQKQKEKNLGWFK